MSGSNENDQWIHNFYQQSFPSSSVSDATTVTITTTSSPAPFTQQLSPEGGVSKPTRRRSRASRRTPTTLLNTDTTNFRAMVQQFTGGPSASSAAAAANLPNLGLSFGPRPVHVNPIGLGAAPYAGYHQAQAQAQLYQQQQQQQYMYSDRALGTGGGGGIGNVANEHESGVFIDHGGGRFFLPTTSSS